MKNDSGGVACIPCRTSYLLSHVSKINYIAKQLFKVYYIYKIEECRFFALAIKEPISLT